MNKTKTNPNLIYLFNSYFNSLRLQRLGGENKILNTIRLSAQHDCRNPDSD